jgi:hypothetical protein
MEIKVFNYVETLDCFVVNSEFSSICDSLGLSGREQTAWIGRYFSLDNDYGEHWFDNWEMRDVRETKAKDLGIEYHSLLIIDPGRLRNGYDGPCHSDEDIKMFWTSVLRSLTLDVKILIAEARQNNNQLKGEEEYLPDLEDRIAQILKKYRIGISA